MNLLEKVKAEKENRLAYTPEEAAKALKVSESTLYRLMKAGTIKYVQLGGIRRIPKAALEELLTV